MFRALALVCVASLCVCSIGCSGSQEGRRESEPLPIGAFAPPSPNQALSGNVIIGGWAIHESGIRSVEIYVDREFVMTANVGLERPDVVKVFPSFGKEMISGWNALLMTGGLEPGPHELLARARAKSGAQRDFVVPVTIVKSP